MLIRFFQNAVLWLFLLGPFTNNLAQKADTRPNIIYMMADDMGYADLSCFGRKNYKTPNIDQLAEEGLKFTNAYAGGPLCTPTRVSFMTGRYPARSALGLREPLEWSAKDSIIGLTPDLPSIASLVRSKGYETALIGKWHLGFAPQFSPNRNGFDYFLGFHGGGIDYVSHKSPSGMPDLFENENPVNIDGYMTDILSDKAISFIQQAHSKPFFLSLQFNAPHWPWQAPGDKAYPDTMRWRSGGSEATYAGIMKSLDDNVGRILNALKQAGLDKNTIVFFVSDNGGERFSDMGGLSGSKAGLWEGGIRVPAIVKWPGKIRASTVSSQPVITMDWSATILAIAGAKPEKKFPIDGLNLVPWFNGGNYEVIIPRTFYWRVFQRNQQKAMREGNWKYLQDEKGAYLFDLSNDMSEKTNLKEKEAAVFLRLKKKYQQWEKTVLKPIPLGN